MDLDAYVAAHHGQWRELEALVDRSRLSAHEAERLVDLYQAVASHLSALRTSSPDPALVLALSNLLARARRRAGRDRPASLTSVAMFYTHTFPAALYRLRRWWLTTALVSVLVAVATGVWIAHSPGRLAATVPPDEINQIVHHDFANYYRNYAASHFALQVWTNNAFLSIEAVALGILGLPVILLLWNNMLNVGVMGAIMTTHHRAAVFWTLILPHGLLELTAVFVACGAGLRLFWSWIEPGPRTRSASVAREGRTTVMMSLGVATMLAVSGVLEAFVTPSPLPPPVRLTIGALVWGAFLVYALVLGRRRVREGFDGDVARVDRGEHMVAVD